MLATEVKTPASYIQEQLERLRAIDAEMIAERCDIARTIAQLAETLERMR